MSRSVSRMLLALVFIAIAGCGFHLRGAVKIPDSLKQMYVQGVNFQQGMGLELKRSLLSNEVNVLADYREGSAVLTILDNKYERRVLSVGSDAKVREYQLYASVTIKLTNADNEIVINSEKIEALRDYQFDQNQLLASDQEEALLRQELYQQLAQNILRRIAVLE